MEDYAVFLEEWKLALMQADCPFKLDAGYGLAWDARWPARLSACLFCAALLAQTR